MTIQSLAVALAVALVLGAVAVWLSATAGRLDRLHIRLATAQASLERQLVERAAAAADVAHCGALDPAAAVLLLTAADAARDAARARRGSAAGPAGRNAAESALSVDLRAVLGVPEAVDQAWRHHGAPPLLVDLAAACDRVRLARRFHDDLAARARAVRRRRIVRWAHLAGHAVWPVVLDLDDEPPGALLARLDS